MGHLHVDPALFGARPLELVMIDVSLHMEEVRRDPLLGGSSLIYYRRGKDARTWSLYVKQ